MALKRCRECKREVSTQAKTCPNCGAPTPTESSGFFGKLVGGVAGIIFIGMLAGRGGQGTSEASLAGTSSAAVAPAQKPENVTASRVAKAFEANEAAAEDAYKGRCFDVSGTVESINAGIGQDVQVALAGGLMGVYINDVPREFAKKLNKGDLVTLSVKGITEILSIPTATYSPECRRLSGN